MNRFEINTLDELMDLARSIPFGEPVGIGGGGGQENGRHDEVILKYRTPVAGVSVLCSLDACHDRIDHTLVFAESGPEAARFGRFCGLHTFGLTGSLPTVDELRKQVAETVRGKLETMVERRIEEGRYPDPDPGSVPWAAVREMVLSEMVNDPFYDGGAAKEVRTVAQGFMSSVIESNDRIGLLARALLDIDTAADFVLERCLADPEAEKLVDRTCTDLMAERAAKEQLLPEERSYIAVLASIVNALEPVQKTCTATFSNGEDEVTVHVRKETLISQVEVSFRGASVWWELTPTTGKGGDDVEDLGGGLVRLAYRGKTIWETPEGPIY